MCEYIKWIFNPDNINTNIFTVISVVLSGLISWGISAIYFSRGNRNNLRASVLCPIRRLLENNPITNENYRKLAEYTKDYSMKYLKSREHPIVDELLSAYQEVCRYKYEYVCAESLQSYFNYKLKKWNRYDSCTYLYWRWTCGCWTTARYVKFCDDLERAIEQFPPEYDDERCLDAVTKLFRHYCKRCYTDKDIIFLTIILFWRY